MAHIMPVTEINWVNPTIERGGVCPVYKNGGYNWVGFGVSNYSSLISPLGGSFEEKDYDLLSTSVREYNEEVGSNFKNITEDEVTKRYAVMNKNTIQIFLPIAPPLTQFLQTEELFDMLWVTPAQLNLIVENSQLSYKGIRIFQVGRRFLDLMSFIATNVSNETAFFSFKNTYPFIREQKFIKEDTCELKYSYRDFIESTANPSNYMGHTSIFVDENTIGVIDKKKNVYIFDKNPQALRKLQSLPTRLYLSFYRDFGYFERNNNLKEITTILSTPEKVLTRIFKENVLKARAKNDIVEELILMEKYEDEIYKIKEKSGESFIRLRALVLSSISFLNYQLTKYGPIKYRELLRMLRDFLSGMQAPDIEEKAMVDMLLRINFYKNNNGVLSIW